ncbi:MAG: hypothetical protein PHQ86_09655 [Dehalococcoidales bacterium]|nr:hypothetical protein [Dehalococcoidales bacterium]
MSKDKTTALPGTDILFGTKSKEEEKVPKVSQSSNESLPIKFAPVSESEPVKFTFYFPPQLLEDLEVAKFRLRMEKRLKVSKSDIVNAALRYAMKDFAFLERLVSGKLD